MIAHSVIDNKDGTMMPLLTVLSSDNLIFPFLPNHIFYGLKAKLFHSKLKLISLPLGLLARKDHHFKIFT